MANAYIEAENEQHTTTQGRLRATFFLQMGVKEVSTTHRPRRYTKCVATKRVAYCALAAAVLHTAGPFSSISLIHEWFHSLSLLCRQPTAGTAYRR